LEGFVDVESSEPWCHVTVDVGRCSSSDSFDDCGTVASSKAIASSAVIEGKTLNPFARTPFVPVLLLRAVPLLAGMMLAQVAFSTLGAHEVVAGGGGRDWRDDGYRSRQNDQTARSGWWQSWSQCGQGPSTGSPNQLQQHDSITSEPSGSE
jgi:hypothetical protein